MADDVLILIPARMASTRLPGKPLADIAGQPMIVHVLRARRSRRDRPGRGRDRFRSDRGGVEKAGGRAVMTRADHASGSDRIFEALGADRSRKAAPGSWSTCRATCRRSTPADLAAALAPLADPAVDIATLAAEITQAGGAHQSERGEGGRLAGRARTAARALFHPRHRARRRRAALSSHRALRLSPRGAGAFVKLPPSPLEQREKLEQLRALEAGMRIDVAIVDTVPLGVDTPEDLETRARCYCCAAAR